MSKNTITAFFDTRDHANDAVLALKQAGVPESDITVSPETARDELGSTGTYAGSTEHGQGFWASLENLFTGTDDRYTYAEGIRRGGTLLTAHVEDGHMDRIVAILEQYGAVDLDEREETWRSEGWTGATTSSSAAAPVLGAGAAGLASTTTASADLHGADLGTTSAVSESVAPVARTGAAQGDVLQVVEEDLNVGKRAVSRGKVRVHSYLVEKDVSENVTLRDETVSIDRRPVDRPVAALDADAFKERTIEMEEVDEEAVVGKTARVVEEIGIRKDATERTETVRDTVRSTKVDIDDGRGTAATQTMESTDLRTRLVKDLEVVGADGRHVGVIDHVDGDMLKLKKLDPSADGQHHLLPAALVAAINDKAVLSVTAAEAMNRWTAAG